jgi:hypothetical protein
MSAVGALIIITFPAPIALNTHIDWLLATHIAGDRASNWNRHVVHYTLALFAKH